MNDRVVPFFDEHEIGVSSRADRSRHRVLRQAGEHEYELYLAIENIDHTRTKARSPQTNGICERFHKTLLDEFYRVRSARSSIGRSLSCKPISISGLSSTMRCAPIRGDGAMQDPDANLHYTLPVAKEKLIQAA